MKIGLIIHELLIEGGGERQCVCLAHALAEHGHDVTVWTSAYDLRNCFPEICAGLKIREVKRGRWPWLRWPWFVRGYLDMVHLASAIEEDSQVWGPQHWPAQWGAVWLKRRLGGGIVWNCNDVPNFFLKFRRPRFSILKPLYRLYYLLDRRQNRKVNMTLLVSEWAEREYKAIYFGPTSVIRPGVDPVQFKPGGDRAKIRYRFGFSDDEFLLLWLGIFMPHRRLEDGIEAVGYLASRGMRVRLILAGSHRSYPRYVESLKALAHKRGLEKRVIFTDKVADEEIRDFYSACDAFLFPNDQQTWGLAVLEAMACGCAVVVSRGAGVHEVLTDQVNAVLFPPRDPVTLANRIEALINDSGQRHEIAQNGMRLARETYNWDRFAEQIEAVYSRIVDCTESRPQTDLVDSSSRP
jgi:glycosyltransferase involved in cell wall biosynthesis